VVDAWRLPGWTPTPYGVRVACRVLGAVIVSLVMLAGCSSGDDEALPVPSPVGPTTGATSGPGATPSASPSGPVVPEACDDIVPFTRVVQIVRVPLEGGTGRVYADDFPADSGRTARLTCQYGVRPAPAGGEAPPPQLEISLSGYVDDAAALTRLEDTVGSARASGQQVQAQSIGRHDGFLLADAADVTYLVAVDNRTVVVTLARGVVPEPAERVVLLGLAQAAVIGLPANTPATT
jgi:hypothetical protein